MCSRHCSTISRCRSDKTESAPPSPLQSLRRLGQSLALPHSRLRALFRMSTLAVMACLFHKLTHLHFPFFCFAFVCVVSRQRPFHRAARPHERVPRAGGEPTKHSATAAPSRGGGGRSGPKTGHAHDGRVAAGTELIDVFCCLSVCACARVQLNVQNGVLKAMSFLFEYIGEMGKDYVSVETR